MTTAPPRRRRPPARTALLMLARRVHFLAGIAVSPFVLLLALTGLAHTAAPLLDDLSHPTALFAAEVGAHPLPVADQVAAALAEHPSARLVSVTLPDDPARTTRVLLDDGGAPLAVHVDPYTAVPRGEFPSARPPTEHWLAEAHRDLHLGDPGRLYAEFAVSWLPVIVVFGLVLRLSQRRRTGMRAWHGALGLALAGALLLIAFSGVQRTALAGDRLAADPPALAAPAVVPGTAPIGVDGVLALAGLAGTVTVAPPERGDRPYVVSSGTSRVAVDPHAGVVTASVGWADHSPMAKARVVATAFHHGHLFGWPNRVLLAAVALGTIALVVLGYRMWWARAERPPPVWRYLSRGKLAALCACAALLGWLMPVLGGSLLLFIAVDAARR